MAFIANDLQRQGKYYHVNLKGRGTEARKTNCFDFMANEG